MRDGSLDDVVATWVDRILEEHWGRNPGDNEAAVYFALLKRAVLGLVGTHARSRPITDYRKEITEVLTLLREELPASTPTHSDAAAIAGSTGIEKATSSIEAEEPPDEQPSEYWAGDSWRKDFYTTFNRWFWDMRDYARPAGRRKTEFLWDVAEVWVATAASAMVYYAKDDRHRWFETAQMLRFYADLTEADELRSLSWGRWGRYSKKNHRPKGEAA